MKMMMMMKLRVVPVIIVLTLVCLINTRSGVAELKKKSNWNQMTFFRLGAVTEREREISQNDQQRELYFISMPGGVDY